MTARGAPRTCGVTANAAAPAPGFVIAGLSLNRDTTAMASGLVTALSAGGAAVASFAVGPDRSDIALVPGRPDRRVSRPRRTLDPVLVGEHRIAPLYAHGSAGCDLAVLEAVSGLFDRWVDDPARAAVTATRGSAAHVAGLLELPVVLVLDVQGYSETLAAVRAWPLAARTSSRIM